MQTRSSIVMLMTSLGLLTMSACVSQGKYDNALADATRARAELRDARASASRGLSETRAELSSLKQLIAQAEARCGRATTGPQDAKVDAFVCVRALDEATALNGQLRAELERLGNNVDELISSKGALAVSLDQARARLDELRKAQAAADARAKLFRDLALRLKRMVDAGELKVVLRGGRMVLVLAADVLFDSGRTEIKPRGKEALTEIGAVLVSMVGREFQVAGHTDNEPIRFSGFESNWDLSTHRALEVVRHLVKSGMRADTLSAAGYGEFDPIAANDTLENKARNRRIEIVLEPRIDEFVVVPDAR